MLSTLVVIVGVLAGLVVLLALIVTLSARPVAADRAAGDPADRAPLGRPVAWSPATGAAPSEIPAIR